MLASYQGALNPQLVFFKNQRVAAMSLGHFNQTVSPYGYSGGYYERRSLAQPNPPARHCRSYA
jgi:hypothetical protein